MIDGGTGVDFTGRVAALLVTEPVELLETPPGEKDFHVYPSSNHRRNWVECVRGALWITQDRDFEDHFLAANDALTLDRRGLAVEQ